MLAGILAGASRRLLANASRRLTAAAGASTTVAAATLAYNSQWSQNNIAHAENAPASLHGKTALITGGTGAIGWAVASSLAAQGCRIALVDLDQKRCDEFAAKLPTASIGLAFDVSDPVAVKENVAKISTQLGGVDVLVNVAGILSNNKLLETSPEEWRKVHAVNHDAAFYLSQACVPHMAEQGWGRIINISSWAWKSGGLTAGTAYSASKAAMVGLTFSLARQFAGDGVTANAVAPCYVFSPMVMKQLTAEKRAELQGTIPVKRFCGPEEVAHAVAFLASPLAGFITGEVIDMNGGFQMD